MKASEQKFQDEIEIERMWLAAKQGELLFFSITPASFILVFALWEHAPHRLLLSWFFILAGINFCRWMLCRYHHLHKAALTANVRRFKRMTVLGCLLAGGWVGMANVWFLDFSQGISVVAISIFTLLIGIGAILSWFSYLPAVAAVMMPSAWTLAAVLLLHGDKSAMALGLLFIIMSFRGIEASLRLAEMLDHALRLNFENAALRKEFEEKSMLLETALENMGQGIAMSDKHDCLRLWNRQFIKILGVAGKKVCLDAGLDAILDAAAPPVEINPEGRIVYRLENGDAYEVRQSGLKQGGRVITFTDITDLMKREQSLKKARKEAIEANCAKIRFLATASHDLRQPIHALGLFFAELSERVRNPVTAQLIGQIDDCIEAINTMLNALLDVSKLDAGIIKPNAEAFNLQPLFERLQLEFRRVALENNNELRFHPVTAFVHTDPSMLERMLRNLIGNALRYTKNGRILVAARKRGENLEINVMDTGIGIPEDKFDEIFVEFHQLHNPARDRRQGLGLGLAIVKRLANLLHHELKVASRLGRGSCFSITLPLVSGSVGLGPSQNGEAALGASSSLAGHRLLVLDDDIAVREGMKGLLNHWGCEVITAATPAEADSLLAGIGPKLDLLIVDYRLADNISGINVARDLRKTLGYPVGVLIITGDTGPERLQEAEASGFPLLHKPVQPAKLRSTLQYLISKGGAAVS